MPNALPEEPCRSGDRQAVVIILIEQPTWGQARVPDELRQHGVVISPFCLRFGQRRHDLETMTRRPKALEAKVSQEGMILTEAQVVAREEAKIGREIHGAFDRACPATSLRRIRTMPAR